VTTAEDSGGDSGGGSIGERLENGEGGVATMSSQQYRRTQNSAKGRLTEEPQPKLW